MGAPSFDQRQEQINIPEHGGGSSTVAPMHIPAVNAPWWTDLHGWGAILGGLAAILAAWGTIHRLTHQKKVKDD